MNATSLRQLLRDLRRPFTRRQRRAEARLLALGEAAIEPVAAVLFTPEANVSTQGTAVRVLIGIGTPATIPHLLRAVAEGGYADFAAARHLASTRDPTLWKALLTIAETGKRSAAEAALTALGERASAALLPDLARIIQTRTDPARATALATAARLGGPAAFSILAPLLSDPDAATRYAAARALVTSRHPEAATRIAAALPGEKAELILRGMAECLVDLGAAEHMPTILDVMQRLKDHVRPLEGLRGVTGVRPAAIARHLDDPTPALRIATAHLLGNSGRPEAVGPLLAHAADPDPGVRRQVRGALRTLARAGVSVTLPPLGFRDRLDAIRRPLTWYFRIPSREGFSAYRTGWVAHLAFSALVAAACLQLVWYPAVWSLGTGIWMAFVSVFLLWGVGVLVGILSHYSPLLTVAALVGLAYIALQAWPPLWLGAGVAGLVHLAMRPFAALLAWGLDTRS